jgi:isopentenyl-diphosphate delta-isomerase
MMEEQVVLVDARDNELGTAPKLKAHVDGSLHRAISVFIFNSAGEMLLQQRSAGKYHSPGLWTNACCTHPRPGEKPHQAAIRRLREEMGIATELAYTFSFIYKVRLGNDLWEHELDHVFVGTLDEDPTPSAEEVAAWRWVAPAELREELARSPRSFTAWFPLALDQLTNRDPSTTPLW